jgi:hypothetical protein
MSRMMQASLRRAADIGGRGASKHRPDALFAYPVHDEAALRESILSDHQINRIGQLHRLVLPNQTS